MFWLLCLRLKGMVFVISCVVFCVVCGVGVMVDSGEYEVGVCCFGWCMVFFFWGNGCVF